ncbi:methyltransferase-like protein 13 isoform X2 [Pomacea canaliculata]|nr:methyltransferase-like protein 13 isoform X2 [Pomacea canaliculata]
MDLLPRSHTEFSSSEYWNSFFRKRGQKAFEWYGEFTELCGIFHKYIKLSDRVLMVGCGNSRLSEEMYDVGYHSIANIDISDIVIKQMREKNAKQRLEMTFEKMDVTQMTYNDSSFSVALDKGTLDALAVDQEEKTLETVKAMFNEIDRVLRFGGRYIIVSLLQDHVISVLAKYFSDLGWPIRVHRVPARPEGDAGNEEFSLPVFAVVLTKFKKMSSAMQIVEVCSSDDDEVQRLESIDQLLSTVKQMQYYGIVRLQLSKRSVTEEQLELALYSSLTTTPRYTLWVVDSEERCSNKFAVFIVPQGREMEWMFSTSAGRRALGVSAGFQRLLVVALSREHEYKDMEAVKAELSSKVMELVPSSYKKGIQVPFLSLGSDIGKRTVRHRGNSELSGGYVVEDFEDEDGQVFRRLIFLTNQNVVQSEVRLVAPHSSDKRKKKAKNRCQNLSIDKDYLACRHHHAMVAGLAFIPSDVISPQVLLVGLGGGPLAAFINHHFPKVQLEAVEIDPEMSKVAREWFGFSHDRNVVVHIVDGLDYIRNLGTKCEKRQMVMLDVDSKDMSLGLSCPPPSFVEKEFLSIIYSLLEDGG